MHIRLSAIIPYNYIQITHSSRKGQIHYDKVHTVAIDTETGNMVCNRTMNPKVKSNAISMHIIGKDLG
jgi:hypothetical protein